MTVSARARALMAMSIVAVTAMSGTAAASAAVPTRIVPAAAAVARAHRVCSLPKLHAVACSAIRSDGAIEPAALRTRAVDRAATPSGYGPSDLRNAYAIPSATGTPTVAIVDAQDAPNAESDLAVYRSQYGLPACTTANGCFRKVNQNGAASPLPKVDNGWAEEISLDIDMVSAVCPACHILLVEATSPTTTNLGTGVNTAVRLGAKFVSNSYGGSESSSDASTTRSYYTHPGVVMTVSSGDDGYGVEYPAASPTVTAVGGTSLVRSSNARGWTEAAWGTVRNTNGGAGSGCSRVETQPTFQSGVAAITAVCKRRAVADVSAVADPNTGVAVYDSASGGWLVFGGTSVAAPVIASVYAVAGTPGSSDTPNTYPYSHTGSLNDVTTGANGTCGGTVLCTSKTGWDGPTGLGTPNGVGAFRR